jgi:hypothetical protein
MCNKGTRLFSGPPLFLWAASRVNGLFLGLANHFRRLTSVLHPKVRGCFLMVLGQGEPTEGLDFNQRMGRLIGEISTKVDEFRRFDPDRVSVGVCFDRRRPRGGALAYVLPLVGPAAAYRMTFVLPRFLHLRFREKLETVVHELYHISPAFDGGLRSFRWPRSLHGRRRAFDRRVTELTDLFLGAPHDSRCYDFLIGGPRELSQRYGAIVGRWAERPSPPTESRPGLLSV